MNKTIGIILISILLASSFMSTLNANIFDGLDEDAKKAQEQAPKESNSNPGLTWGASGLAGMAVVGIGGYFGIKKFLEKRAQREAAQENLIENPRTDERFAQVRAIIEGNPTFSRVFEEFGRVRGFMQGLDLPVVEEAERNLIHNVGLLHADTIETTLQPVKEFLAIKAGVPLDQLNHPISQFNYELHLAQSFYVRMSSFRGLTQAQREFLDTYLRRFIEFIPRVGE